MFTRWYRSRLNSDKWLMHEIPTLVTVKQKEKMWWNKNTNSVFQLNCLASAQPLACIIIYTPTAATICLIIYHTFLTDTHSFHHNHPSQRCKQINGQFSSNIKQKITQVHNGCHISLQLCTRVLCCKSETIFYTCKFLNQTGLLMEIRRHVSLTKVTVSQIRNN